MRRMMLILTVLALAGLACPAEKKRFAENGLPVGGALPDLTAMTMDGEAVSLSSLWKDGPVVFVTASLTCPVARRTTPLLEYLEKDYSTRLNLVIIYTIEAHPQGDPSPYSDKEWVTSQNKEEHILVAQPKSPAERKALAEQFVKQVNPPSQILVDGMDNEIWALLGAGPNVAVLVDRNGHVRAKQDWFRLASLKGAIEQVLGEKQPSSP
ncbi:MAG: hypothetical protein K9M45_11385 [Kiritimatiellales bacterium]|nr:hypothetical protein [Kiritimatiellales bacterium]